MQKFMDIMNFFPYISKIIRKENQSYKISVSLFVK